MTDFLRQLWEPVAKLPKAQQIALGIITLMVFSGIILATMWGAQKDYTPLFEEQLKIEDAGNVVAKLTELNISYKLGANSSDIQVPLADKSYILLRLAQEKALPQARPGWQKLIDERSIFAGTTQQEFELNYVRGLQEELESGLVRLEPIENAKVYIVMPRREIFKEDQKETSASIVLQLRPGFEISRDQIRAIRDWITTAVEGLQAENIRITDTTARDLTRALDDEDDMTLDRIKSAQLKHIQAWEHRLERRLQSQLETVFGFGKAVVRVNAELDFDQREAVSDVIIPPIEGSDQGLIISEKIENEEYRGRDLVEDGEPGVNSNLPPGAPAYPGTEDATWNEYKRSAKIANYEFTRSKERFVKDQGNLKRLSVSVILDGDPIQLGTEIEDQIRSVAQATVGFSKPRGDVLTLMVMPFNNDLAVRAQRDLEERQRQERQMFMIVIGLLMSIPVFLGMVYMFVRVSRARAIAKEHALIDQAQREAEALQQAEQMRKTKIREQQLQDWERRFQDISNFFPEIEDIEEKKRKVQDLRYKAYLYARENNGLPPDFDEMTPEEQFLFKEAFQKKADGTLDEGITRLESVLGEREKKHMEDLDRLKHEADSREKLEQRVRRLVESNPADAVQVLRLWLSE